MTECFAGGHLRYLEGAWRDDDGNPVDVVEVRHGRWISIAGKPHMIYECSLCNDRWNYGAVIHMNYCPNCGGDMRERKDGE